MATLHDFTRLIEAMCAEARTLTQAEVVEMQLRADLHLYGICCSIRHPDGTIERIDPARVHIAPAIPPRDA